MISISTALSKIIDEAKVLNEQEEDILSSLNKVLAEDIYSRDNLPPFDKSAMDGYALKSEDTLNDCSFEIVGIVRAGDYCESEIKSGQVMKIMTGAPLPVGADAVIEIEKVKVDSDKLLISDIVKRGNHVIKFGEEIKEGDLALSKGHIIRAGEIGLLASLGYNKVKTYKSPKVAIIITGDELVNIDEKLTKGKIRNSNEYSLKALAQNLKVDVLSLGIVSDDKDVLKEKVKYALDNADIVITSGGASVGDYDFVDDVLREIGADIKFTKIAIKPGKPVLFATYNEKLFFGLPGNPLSLITTFEEFIKPAIKKMMGYDVTVEKEFPVVLATDFKAKTGRVKYVYANILKEDDKYYAYDVGSQCSNHLMTMSKANAIVIIPEDRGTVRAGEILNGKFIFK